MSRVTSLTNVSDKQVNRWIKRLGLLLMIGLVAFIAFYAVDRFRMPQPSIADQRLAALETAVRNDPADIASRGRLADLYLAMSRYDDAITQYTQIIGTHKNDKAAYVSRGRALELKGDLAGAAADYQKIVDMAKDGEMANADPVLELAYYGLGVIAIEQNKPTDAVDLLTKALAIKRTDADALNKLGLAYVKAGENAKAIEVLRKAVLFVPIGWSEPYQSMSLAYAGAGDKDLAEWAGAMAAWQSGDAATAQARLQALADGKAGLDARIGLGLMAETGGDTAGAASWYRKALELDATNESALLGLSRVTDGSAGSHPSLAPSATPEGSN